MLRGRSRSITLMTMNSGVFGVPHPSGVKTAPPGMRKRKSAFSCHTMGTMLDACVGVTATVAPSGIWRTAEVTKNGGAVTRVDGGWSTGHRLAAVTASSATAASLAPRTPGRDTSSMKRASITAAARKANRMNRLGRMFSSSGAWSSAAHGSGTDSLSPLT